MVIITEIHNWSACKRLRDCKILSPKWDINITPFLSSWKRSSRGGRKTAEPEGGEDSREMVFSEHGVLHMGAMTAYTRPPQIKPTKSQHGWKRGLWRSTLSWGTIGTWWLLGSKSQFSSVTWTEDYLCFRDSPTPTHMPAAPDSAHLKQKQIIQKKRIYWWGG